MNQIINFYNMFVNGPLLTDLTGATPRGIAAAGLQAARRHVDSSAPDRKVIPEQLEL